jgi:hypothetical protein
VSNVTTAKVLPYKPTNLNIILWHSAALYCSISFEVMFPSACSFIVNNLQYSFQ